VDRTRRGRKPRGQPQLNARRKPRGQPQLNTWRKPRRQPPDAARAVKARKHGTNARSSCYKLGTRDRRWLQGFHGMLRSGCNDLSEAGYKQVFDR
jgi:hypothetical protein